MPKDTACLTLVFTGYIVDISENRRSTTLHNGHNSVKFESGLPTPYQLGDLLKVEGEVEIDLGVDCGVGPLLIVDRNQLGFLMTKLYYVHFVTREV